MGRERRRVSPDGTIILSQGVIGIIDVEDIALVERYTFSVIPTKAGNHAVRAFVDGARYEFLHRLLTGAPRGMVVDHINGSGLDNRRCNLRVCTYAENAWNQRLRSDSKTGFKGVVVQKGRYRALINTPQRRLIGCFGSAEDAARAYDAAAREHYGEFACLNFPNEGEQSVHRGRGNNAAA